jgi:hypothetical protein
VGNDVGNDGLNATLFVKLAKFSGLDELVVPCGLFYEVTGDLTFFVPKNEDVVHEIEYWKDALELVVPNPSSRTKHTGKRFYDSTSPMGTCPWVTVVCLSPLTARFTTGRAPKHRARVRLSFNHWACNYWRLLWCSTSTKPMRYVKRARGAWSFLVLYVTDRMRAWLSVAVAFEIVGDNDIIWHSTIRFNCHRLQHMLASKSIGSRANKCYVSFHEDDNECVLVQSRRVLDRVDDGFDSASPLLFLAARQGCGRGVQMRHAPIVTESRQHEL